MLRKRNWQILAARYNWCQGPVPGHGPAVEKHWSKTWVCSCWLVGNVSLISARGMDVFVLRVLCDGQVEVSCTVQIFVHWGLMNCGVLLSVVRRNRQLRHLQWLCKNIRLKKSPRIYHLNYNKIFPHFFQSVSHRISSHWTLIFWDNTVVI